MKKSILLSFLLAGGVATSYAQDKADVLPAQPMFQHQVGVQMNELIRQVFNFNNTATATVANPYLLMYTLTHSKTGFGLRLGAGYIQRTFVDDDGVNARDGKINDLNLRVGLEKSFVLSNRWSAGAGADFVYADKNNETKSILKAADTTITQITSNTGNIGGGAMGWLRYHITKNVLIGTEASFYYRVGHITQTIDVTRRDFSIPARPMITTSTKIDNDESEGVFSLPTVFYLIVKF